MPLSRHGVETYQETSSHATRQGTLGQSSQLAEPLWTDPGLKSGISVRKLIPTLKKKRKKEAQARNDFSIFSQNPRTRGKSHHNHLGTFEVKLTVSVGVNTLFSLGERFKLQPV